ncbi:DUF6188 family protein [Glycomyces arizonensis]|uniref:DUF6188 family protein n=1 Tax=Glycomyces arizonensis TaxID=256035 RepID=UPI0004081BBA|nr:DUF6188 family protein [Glycomyces arizonensis]
MLQIVELNDQVINEVSWKTPIELHTGGGWTLDIESEVAVTDTGGDRFTFAGDDKAAPSSLQPELSGRIIEEAVVGAPTGLRIDFGGGVQLTAPAAPDFEAWHLTGPEGQRIVCLPGGEVSVQGGSRPV